MKLHERKAVEFFTHEWPNITYHKVTLHIIKRRLLSVPMLVVMTTRCYFHQILPLAPLLNQLNPARIRTLYFLNIPFNIILPFMPNFPWRETKFHISTSNDCITFLHVQNYTATTEAESRKQKATVMRLS